MNTQEQALAVYEGRMEVITGIIERLAEWAEDMGGISPDTVNWTHVSNLGAVLAHLENAAYWANIDLVTVPT